MKTLSDYKNDRVLVVDDEPNMRVTLRDILQHEGYEVMVAATGEEAVRMCSEQVFSFVLLDLRMPGMDGVETFRQIRKLQSGIRVIMMSAYSIDAQKDEALNEGAIAFLSKPLALDQLMKLVGEIKDAAVLVVEPEEPTATLLYDNLREQGYRVTVTGSPNDALELATQIRFDFIFIEVELSEMNGLELYLAFKKAKLDPIVIMICSEKDEFQALAKEAVKRTAYTIINKPLDVGQVQSTIDRVTKQRLSNHIRKPQS